MAGPGPYDIYGNPEEERSFSSRLPFGMGGDGVGSWLPELGTFAVSSLAYRYGIKKGMGNGMFGGGNKWALGMNFTRAEKVASKAVEKASKIGGTMADTRAGHAAAMYGQRVRRGSNVAIPGASIKVGWGRTKRVEDVYNAPGVKFRGQGSFSYPVTSKFVQHKMGQISTATQNAAKWTHFGRAGLGLATTLGVAQLGAMTADFGKSFAEAAIDWRPRKDSSSQMEFGDRYQEISGAYTQRQRAIMAIHDSQLTTRAAIGGEAAFMHN